MQIHHDHDQTLPIKQRLTTISLSSILVSLLLAATSAAGLIFPTAIYPTEEQLQMFLPNDVVNLLVGVPILVVSIWLASRGNLVGLLLWPGSLYFVVYNDIAYVFGAPFNPVFPLYIIRLTLSVFTLVGLLAGIETGVIRKKLSGLVYERLSGGVLVGLGSLFAIRALGVMFGALLDQVSPPSNEMPVLIADLLISPATVIGGVLLWRRQALGYTAGLGLLFQLSMLFIGLIIFLVLQPILTAAPLALTDIVVVFVMGLVCFIPFGLYLRGALASRAVTSNIA